LRRCKPPSPPEGGTDYGGDGSEEYEELKKNLKDIINE
jgi:hypothetical protein